MIDLKEAPRSGRILAYAPDRLIYDGFTLQEETIVLRSGEALDTDRIYELHLFDADTEFRSVCQNGEWTVNVMRAWEETDSGIDHFVFPETQFVQERYWVDGPDEKIVVNNRFSFDENGFLRLAGYRLAMEPEKE